MARGFGFRRRLKAYGSGLLGVGAFALELRMRNRLHGASRVIGDTSNTYNIPDNLSPMLLTVD